MENSERLDRQARRKSRTRTHRLPILSTEPLRLWWGPHAMTLVANLTEYFKNSLSKPSCLCPQTR